MGTRTRKLIGAVVLIVFVVAYMWIAMLLTAIWLGDKPGLLQGFGYAFAGLIWIVPAGAIISWMSKPGR